jgi:hypothetical protein
MLLTQQKHKDLFSGWNEPPRPARAARGDARSIEWGLEGDVLRFEAWSGKLARGGDHGLRKRWEILDGVAEAHGSKSISESLICQSMRNAAEYKVCQIFLIVSASQSVASTARQLHCSIGGRARMEELKQLTNARERHIYSLNEVKLATAEGTLGLSL